MANSAPELIKSIKDKSYSPVYFLQGEEAFYIDQISDLIEKSVLTEAEKGFNLIILYGKDHKMHEVLTNAKRFPMMAQHQVVIVKEAQEIQDLKKQEGRSLLQNYIKEPVPSTILVFCHKHKKLDGKTALSKALGKHSALLTTQALRDYQVPAWVKEYVHSKKAKINETAVQLLADHIGNNLSRIANEIDKVLINIKPSLSIDEEIIQKNVGISKEYNVFELQKSILFRDVVKANKIANYFAANEKKNPVIPVIALLFSLFCKIIAVHQTSDKSERNLATELKVGPYFVKDYITGARNYSLGKSLDNVRVIHNADMQSKGIDSPSMNNGRILKQLVFELIH